MIEVEIKGPVAKKEYEKMKKTLEETGENILREKRASIVFVGEHSHAFTDIEISSGKNSKIILRDHKNKSETVLSLERDQFSKSVEFCAKLGYTKGVVSIRDFFCASYGGAYFSLVDPLENDSLYYEATIMANDPTSAKEAKKKLEALARKFKLPIWGNLEMVSYFEKLNKQTNYMYDYGVHGAHHFKDKFGI
jgi:adenylate cyclase class IV